MQRQEMLTHIQENPEFDVLVIGGGINGIGTYRELALQGLRVLLVEKNDFCSGASAASSHMLHGGIRYLENGEFRLVREALHERNRMLKNAPHYAKPLPTTIPMFRWFSGMFNAPLKFIGLLSRPAERGAIIIKAGLVMYDAFTGPEQTMPGHTFRMKQKSLQAYPQINKDIICTATYYDAWMPYPERICMELIADAESNNAQAYALNYMGADDAQADSVTLRDEATGQTYTVKPRTVINAAGPWIDFVNRAMQQKTEFIGGTKGSHLILDHPQLFEACNGSEIFFENSDGRIVLIFPYMNRVMVGTTDIRIEDPSEAICTDDEIAYILGMIPKVFPDIQVDRSQIVFTFSGVRPLPKADGRTGAISRDHSIKTLQPDASNGLKYPIHSLIGGKWTSWRAFSEQTADKVLGEIDAERKVDTKNRAFGGGKDYPKTDDARQQWLQKLQERTELPIEQLQMLFERYGTHAADVAEYMSAVSDAPLQHHPDYTRREVEYITQQEKVQHLDDFILRRSLIAMLGYVTQQPELLEELADAMGSVLGWSEEEKDDEVMRARRILKQQNRVELEIPVMA